MDRIIIGGIVAALLLLMGILGLYARYYKIAPPGFALVRFGQGGLRISFSKMMVFPVVHKLEYLDLRLKHFSLHQLGKSGVICRNNLRINLGIEVFMRVNAQSEAIAMVVQNIGCKRLEDPQMLGNLFLARFQEAVQAVTKEFDYEDIIKHREAYQNQILNAIGIDLQGFTLENFIITQVNLVNSALFDPNNILDAEAIRLHAKKLFTIKKENDQQEARLQREIKAYQVQIDEEALLNKNQLDEQEALHQADMRFLEEQAGLDERMIRLKVKLEAEKSADIKKRLTKQIEEIKQKRAGLDTQLDLEKKSIKVRYQRKILDAHQSNELPPEAKE